MSLKGVTVLLFTIWLSWVGGALLAQSTQLNFRHFTTNDGLPSSETYVSLEDNDGNLWVGTDNGVARFDGYEFTVFDSKKGLADAVVFTLELDDSGRIWAGTLSGQLFFFENGTFHSFKYNDRLVALKQNSKLIYFLDVLPGGEVIVKVDLKGLLRVEVDGNFTWLTENDEVRYYVYSPSDKQAGYYPTQSRYFIASPGPGDLAPAGPLFFGDDTGLLPFAGSEVVMKPLRPTRARVVDMTLEGKGLMVVGYDYLSHVLPDGRTVNFKFDGKEVHHAIPVGDDTYMLFAGTGKGIIQVKLDYETLTVERDTFLKGQSLAMGYKDKKGGLWVNSLDAGLFYCPYPDQIIHVIDDNGAPLKPTCLALTGDGGIHAGYANRASYYHRIDEGTHKEILPFGKKPPFKSYDVLYDEDKKSVFNQSFFFEHDIDGDTPAGVFQKYRYGLKSSVYEVKEFAMVGDSCIWTSNNNFGRLDLGTGVMTAKLPFNSDSVTVHGLESYMPFHDGREFIGSWYGLKELLPNGGLVDNNLGIEELSGRIERIVRLAEEKIIFGTRGSGLVYYAPDTSYVINADSNLASNMIRNLHVSEQGVLWVATLKGLSKIAFSEDGKEYDLRTFRIGNGLIDNEVHDVATNSEDVWLASTAGIYQFLEPSLDTASSSPHLLSFSINGKDTTLSSAMDLRPTENDLSFAYGSIIFSLGNTVNYQFRINPDEGWQQTQQRVVNYPNLSPGDYLFEVQSQNQDGKWSESTVVSIYIAEYFYKTTQAWILLFLLSAVAMFFFFRRREKIRIREEGFREEINRLQHSAVHAQMNPHFVFNCLNSIQNFVLHNNIRDATTYLSRFAALIRKTLRSSVLGRHSLQEEVFMLEGYLGLEKLRFKDAFNYEIVTEKGMPMDKIMLPPLLVQPFVENAIIHGFEDMQKGGLVKVKFSGNEDLLTVEIIDNGSGFDPNKKAKEDSMGMSITKQRLMLMSGRKDAGQGIEITPLKGKNGENAGTKIVLNITPLRPDHKIKIKAEITTIPK